GGRLAGEVGLGDDADEALSVLDHRDAADLVPLHDADDLVQVAVGADGVDPVGGHVVAHAALLRVPLGDVAHVDVPVRDHAAQTHARRVLDDGDDADVRVPHELGGPAHRVVGRHDLDVRCHDVAGLHVLTSCSGVGNATGAAEAAPVGRTIRDRAPLERGL